MSKHTEARGYVIQVFEHGPGYIAQAALPVPGRYLDPHPTTVIGKGATPVEAMADLARQLAHEPDHPEAKPYRLGDWAPEQTEERR